MMAGGLDHLDDEEKYLTRSDNWKNMYDPLQTSIVNGTTSSPTIPIDTNFTGFLQPRYLNGTLGFQDLTLCSPLCNFTSCYLNANGHETYEGSAVGAWQ